MDIKGILYLAVGLLLIYACYTDVKKRKISNRISLIVMVLSLILMFFHREWTVPVSYTHLTLPTICSV